MGEDIVGKALARLAKAMQSETHIDLLIDSKEIRRSFEDLTDALTWRETEDYEGKLDALYDLESASNAMAEFFRSYLECPEQAIAHRKFAVRRLRRVIDYVKRDETKGGEETLFTI